MQTEKWGRGKKLKEKKCLLQKQEGYIYINIQTKFEPVNAQLMYTVYTV